MSLSALSCLFSSLSLSTSRLRSSFSACSCITLFLACKFSSLRRSTHFFCHGSSCSYANGSLSKMSNPLYSGFAILFFAPLTPVFLTNYIFSHSGKMTSRFMTSEHRT
ncbi:unnamed protein product [Bacillus phage SPP1]|uniref:Bacteriophage SPP1 complete nucleotide sequence n=1 Tax=Bacillus phage SPP1 TaxID=10724 RepID=O48441_BPSPP|nr:hypothetical protein SPP1p014 [Bacillus phage SPP1]CAA66585.1 unnamed protein product [Bacillus phage SPP1]